MKKNNIVLIGFMGVGKGCVARELFKITKKFPLDCDDLLQSAFNLKIKEIFKIYGEDEFRKTEKNLAKFIEKNISNAIISTGGGFYKVPNLRHLGVVIYLKSDFESIINRIKNSKNATKKLAKRPLLANLEKAEILHNQRDKKYEKLADFVVDVRNLSPQETAQKIKKLLKDKI